MNRSRAGLPHGGLCFSVPVPSSLYMGEPRLTCPARCLVYPSAAAVAIATIAGAGDVRSRKRSGQVAPSVLVVAAVIGGLYLLGVQVHKGVKHLGCIVTSGHKCAPKPAPTPKTAPPDARAAIARLTDARRRPSLDSPMSADLAVPGDAAGSLARSSDAAAHSIPATCRLTRPTPKSTHAN